MEECLYLYLNFIDAMHHFKYLLLILSFVLISKGVYCQTDPIYFFPKPTGLVSDFEGIFQEKEKIILDSIIASYEIETSIEIAIVTIDTNMVSRENFNDYILQLANNWGVGKSGKDNGVVIGLSSHYRKMRICNGYGIEKILSDEETANIMNDEFFSYYKKGEYYAGTLNGLNKLIQKLNEKRK